MMRFYSVCILSLSTLSLILFTNTYIVNAWDYKDQSTWPGLCSDKSREGIQEQSPIHIQTAEMDIQVLKNDSYGIGKFIDQKIKDHSFPISVANSQDVIRNAKSMFR